ncbi:MAG: hypothetical protein AAGB29_07060 [Planctomycetota bacterium]
MALRVVALLLIVAGVGRGAWRVVYTSAVAPAVNAPISPRQAALIDRYRGVGEALGGVERAGYVAEGGGTDGEARLVAGLFALPTVLVPEPDGTGVWLIDAASDDAALAIAGVRGLRPGPVLAAGLLVAESRTEPTRSAPR